MTRVCDSLTAVDPLITTLGARLLTVTTFESVSVPVSSSVTVTLTVAGSDAVPVGASSAQVQVNEPLFVPSSNTSSESTPPVPQLMLWVQPSVPGSVQV